MVICLSCIVNWFALAYRPLGNLLSKKVLKKNSMIRVISGFMHSVSTSSLANFAPKEFSLNMVAVSKIPSSPLLYHSYTISFHDLAALLGTTVELILFISPFFLFPKSTFRGGGNDGQVLFDTSSFLKWWFGGTKSKEPAPAVQMQTKAVSMLDTIENTHEKLSTDSVVRLGSNLLSDVKINSLKKQNSASNVARSSINSPSFLAGYMEYDPLAAATRSHTNTHHSNRRSSWFSRSD